MVASGKISLSTFSLSPCHTLAVRPRAQRSATEEGLRGTLERANADGEFTSAPAADT
jgi:hypothetical protein